MKKFFRSPNVRQLVVGLLLLGVGLISPSNGVDDKVNMRPAQMLFETFLIIGVGLLAYFIYRQVLILRNKFTNHPS